jgi:hypothetical protein
VVPVPGGTDRTVDQHSSRSHELPNVTPWELTWRDTCVTSDLPASPAQPWLSRSGGLPGAPVVDRKLGNYMTRAGHGA